MRKFAPDTITLSLAEAITFIACGRCCKAAVLARRLRMYGGRWPKDIGERLDRAGTTLIRWLVEGRLSARGTWDDKHRSDRHGTTEDIRAGFLLDGAWCQPEDDTMHGDYLAEPFGRPAQIYRYIRVEARPFLNGSVSPLAGSCAEMGTLADTVGPDRLTKRSVSYPPENLRQWYVERGPGFTRETDLDAARNGDFPGVTREALRAAFRAAFPDGRRKGRRPSTAQQ